jgi:hypothetical protein
MKKITLFLSLFICFGSVVFAQNKSGDKTVFGKKVNPENISPSGHIRCATTEYQEFLRKQNPKLESDEKFENWLSQKIIEQQSMSQSGGIIYIPVVVHVIHNGDAYGSNENITDEQVQSQLTVMTQDFRKMTGTPGSNSNPVGADTQIEFVLAKVDPNGNPTNGINRVNLCQASWSTSDINSIVKPSTIWDPTQYMNMWSVNFTDTTLLGYAQFPESTLAGLSTAAQSSTTDGVVAGYGFFGSSDLTTGAFQAPYDKGRTMTHEVGHFLGLRHIWGDDTTCPNTNVATNKDFVADTPAANGPNFGCVSGTNTCPSNPGNDMIQNYMDYTDDTCMNIFTAGQKTRITTVMNNSPRRSTLKTSVKDVAIALFANDAEIIIENVCGVADPNCVTPDPAIPLKTILLYNRGTSNLTSATINYNIDGGTNYVHNWTGSLATNKYAVITLANSTGKGTLNVSIASVNGGADARATNNTASKAFGSSLAFANSTTFTFNLVGDRWSSETSWTLKNAAGTTLYSGGGYPDTAVDGTHTLVANQAWTLPANGCYYLTMNDSYGDGLFDGVGQGYYTVTSGATTLVNVTNFVASNPANTPASKVSYFTNNVALNNDSFSLIEDVVLYPNPSKDFFTIDVPQSIVKSGKMEIYNTLGQKMFTKVISSDSDLIVNISSLTNGVYFLNLNLDNSSKTLRFIKE